MLSFLTSAVGGCFVHRPCTTAKRERLRRFRFRLVEFSAADSVAARRAFRSTIQCGRSCHDAARVSFGPHANFEGCAMIDSIIDIYHLNTVNLATAKANGVVAVIHKATEGATVVDAEYRKRRDKAKALGLLWGAYHYSSGASVSDQVA